MIKRILDSRLPLIVYNPPKVFDKNYFIKCHEAGALPVYDTEFISNDEIISVIHILSKEDILFGIRILDSNNLIKDYITDNHIINLDLIVFKYDNVNDLKKFFFANKDYKIFIETRHIDINEDLEAITPHGLILKGNEAPGRVSKFTSMILMQYYLEKSSIPIFIHGGVGIHTAPGLFAAGVNGIVLDNQLYLTDEAPISENFKDVLGNIKEGDSAVIGDALNRRYRFFAKLGTKIVKDLKEEESFLKGNDDADETIFRKITENIVPLNSPDADAIQSLFYLGQDSIFAIHFVKKSKKLKDVIYNLFQNVADSLNSMEEHDPLVADSKMAREHNTRYPVVLGPMANINDNAEFAHEVYEKGGLPFFAMGNLPANLAEKIISEGKNKFSNFGAGLIGTPEFNKSLEGHLEIIKKYKVPFAIIAVSIPSFVNNLEAEGIKTYLHTPALQMLDNAIKNSCKRFIFEGSEAGGHIGSLTSFVLWEISIEKLLNQPADVLGTQSVLFAGGIGSRSGSFFISGISVILAKLGAKIGIQAGSPYLFTEEIVRTGAMKELYQKLLIERNETTVIGNTVGLSTRTIISPFSVRMLEKEHLMIKEKVPLAERKDYFEGKNVGSLLIASKAYAPDFEKLKSKGELSYIYFNEEEHYDKGNFHTGASIAFFKKQISIKDIHDSFFEIKESLHNNLNCLEIFSGGKNQINDEIAVIGMACIYPDAPDLDAFWKNIVSKKYSIKEVPKDRFDSDLYMSTDRNEEDKSYTNLAGFVDYYEFDNKKYGYKETEAKHISRTQKMILDAAMMAVDDAGYLHNKKLPGDRTSVIIGSCLGNEYGDDMFLLMYYPEMKYHLDKIDEFKALGEKDKEHVLEALKKGLKKGYSPKSPDGAALNVESSRIAKHLNLEGVNYTIDAACATSLAAIDNAQKELLSGSSDVVIVGGVHTNLSGEVFVGFGKMGALSSDGSFPFDNRANGFVLGEGAGVLVLKRVKDAIRDGDIIHGIIKGVGSSSDGKGKAIAAPKTEGQGYAIIRAFENSKSPISHGDIDYIEAHGTATLMGDSTEIKTLMNIYKSSTPIGVSSIKSQIGHLLGGAGAAGLIKAFLAIKNKTLPPNGKFENPSARFTLDNSPFYVIREAKEWVVSDGKPRMAAVSSFGFGGINYHIIVSEFTSHYVPVERKIFSDLDYDFNDDRIVVAGIGIVAPGSKNREEFWNNLQSGKNYISNIPESRFHIDYYADEKDPLLSMPRIKAGIVTDYKFNNLSYKIPPSTMMSIDRVQCFALDAASQAIEQANMKDKFQNGNRIGVIIGTSSGEKHNEHIFRTRIPFIKKILSHIKGIDRDKLNGIISGLENSLKERYHKNTEDTIPGLLSNIVSGRIANYFNCNGPNYTIEAECASSAVGLSVAVKDLLHKNVDFVITGGADTNLAPANLMAFQLLKVLSPEESRIFDKRSKGLVMSEGAALMVLTTYRKARENNIDILGEIKDITFNSYGADNFIAPTTAGFTKVINKFYEKNSYVKKQVDYIDVFASSHVVVDSWEKQALENCFTHKLFFGNIKPEAGYFRSANPAMVISKLILMGYNKKILPNFSFSPEDTIIDAGSVLSGNKDAIVLNNRDSIYLAANFSGLGGNHGHTVVRTLPARFNRMKGLAIPVAAVKDVPVAAIPKGGRVCALLSGQGAQFSGMMKELYDRHDDIRQMMDRGESLFRKARNYSLLEMMFGQDSKINSTENTQPSIFLSTAAIYSHLKGLGFEPDFFIGHSVGEFSALFCAGILGFDDAMNLIIKRSEFMKAAAEAEKGSIMVAFISPEDAVRLIKESGLKNVYLANKNSEAQTAVSGGEKDVDDFCAFLNSKKISFKKLNLSGAFHSPLFKSASDKLKDYLHTLNFIRADFSKIISNVTGDAYPDNPEGIKELLVKQLVSPVEFIGSVKKLSALGVSEFIEIGPNKILINLLKGITINNYNAVPSVDPKKGEAASLQSLKDYLTGKGIIKEPKREEPRTVFKIAETGDVIKKQDTFEAPSGDREMSKFISENRDLVNSLIYREYQYKKAGELLDNFEKFNFYTGKVVVSGVSIGLPGKGHSVFDSRNFDRILAGENCIDPLSQHDKEMMVDKNVIRIFKASDGSAKFQEIKSTDDVIQLAGQLGYFDLHKEYGIDYDYDITYSLAIAAGIEALKDAGIPLVMNYQKTTTGNLMQKGYSLPAEMQENTGVIFSSVFASFETLLKEVYKYHKDRLYKDVYKDFEEIYYFLMEKVGDKPVKDRLTEWFYKFKDNFKDYKAFEFDRNILFNLVKMGAPFFAQLIKAKGPNTQINAACATTTQAVGVAEDWIRTGRCDRVIIIGGEAPTEDKQGQWLGTGFLAIGAATVKKTVFEAAKPFDKNRNGMLLGSGAVAMIIEREDVVKDRGFNGQAEILGTYIKNSAFHPTRLDVKHVTVEMKKFFDSVKRNHGLDDDYPNSLLFMSHETYTPARGGSADAEISALKHAFPNHYKNVLITNTKGFTGHLLGVAIEDAILVKALQKGIAPPIANLTEIPEHFADLKFSRGEKNTYEYGVHFSAGFGSQFALIFIRRLKENSMENNSVYAEWLKRISNNPKPEIKIINNTLVIDNIIPDQDSQSSAKVITAAVQEKISEKKSGPSNDSIITSIKTLIMEQTGYSMDMLESDLDLEADLGIDTVKQVEIFGKISSDYSLEVPENLKLSELNTIQKLAVYIGSKVTVVESSTVSAVVVRSSSDTGSVLKKIKGIISEQTGYSLDMLESDLDLEADLGIDTVKQVEIFGKISSDYSLEVPEDLKLSELNTISKIAVYIGSRVPAEVEAEIAGTGADTGSVMKKIKGIISEQTGYSLDMLDADLDLEADLGIDTVKQVEIFGKISSDYSLEVPEDLKLSELNTISKISAYIGGKVKVAAPAFTGEATSGAVSGTGSAVNKIKAIISEQTGYSLDMLDADLDLEADLGIDTVKQVEIFGKISSDYSLEVPEDLKLSELNTISKIAVYINGKVKTVEPVVSVEALPAAGAGTGSAVNKIKAIISEQTGYSLDMLDADLDLEADLGIDTVKQVEIFGKISSDYSLEVPEDLKLSELNSIRKIAAYITEKSGNAGTGKEAAPLEATQTAPVIEIRETGSIKRYVVGTAKVELPAGDKEENIFNGKTILVSGDEYGFSEKIIKIIKQKKGKVKTIGKGKSFDIQCSLDDLQSVEEAVEGITKSGERIDGFIHLYPLNSYFSGREIDAGEINGSIKSFYIIIRSLYKELNRKGSLISILSFDSIIFPYSGRDLNINPVFTGIAGMMKTINKEMTGVIVKAVDFNITGPVKKQDAIVDRYMKELMSGDRRVETGYDDKEKYVITLSEKSVSQNQNLITTGDRILVSGGARGITFEIIREVARQNKGIKLVLCGRSDITNIDAEFLTEGADEKFIFNALKERMKGAKPLEVKKAASNMMNLKETRANIEELKSMGVEADYHPVDVSNMAALSEVVKKYDRIDGVVHAAGVEYSNIIEKKDMKNFSLVFDTKITGIMNLLEALKEKDVKYFVGFSSVTAKFGNIGQVDYASANDMLGKFLQREKQRNPKVRIKVFDWTAWKDVGMATNESVKKVLLEGGIELLPVEKGVQFFVNDLNDSSIDEVVITNFLPSFDRDGIFMAPREEGVNEALPFIGAKVEETGDVAVYRRVLDPVKDIYLMHHVIEDVPLFLGATGIETMAECAATLAGQNTRIWELSDFSIPYGIKILQGRPKEIVVRSERDKASPLKFNSSITSQFRNKMGVEMGEKILHYSGTYLFTDGEVKGLKIEIPKFNKVSCSGNFDELIYHPKRLFMDGLFKTIEGILSFDNRTLITRFHNTSDCRYFSNMKHPKLVTDAILIDGMFQTGGLFEFLSSNEVVLPFKIRKMNFIRDVVTASEYLCITEKTGSTDKTNVYQITLADNDGNVFLKAEDFEMVRVGKLAPADQVKDKFKF